MSWVVPFTILSVVLQITILAIVAAVLSNTNTLVNDEVGGGSAIRLIERSHRCRARAV